MSAPQYQKTRNPKALEAWRDRYSGFERWKHTLMRQLTERTGQKIEGFMAGDGLGESVSFRGLNVDEVDVQRLPGQWKKPRRKSIYPYKNNPVLDGLPLRWDPPEVPGLPEMVLLDVPGTYMSERVRPRVFEHDGALYAGYYRDPGEHGRAPREGWEEIKASEYYAALEARREKETTDD